MGDTKNIWPVAEAAAHFEELLARAANGDTPQVTDDQGVLLPCNSARLPHNTLTE